MESASPTRPSRRAAGRRKIIVDESDEENIPVTVKEEEEDDFTTAPQESPRRRTRRRATEAPATPHTAGRTRRAKTGDSLAPSQILESTQHDSAPLGSPTKRASPRKRNSAAPVTKRPQATLKSEGIQLPTPNPSATPEPSQVHGTPLNDVTDSVNNEQAHLSTGQKGFASIKPMDTVLEKPMDIVIRSRTLAAPQKQEDAEPKPRTVIKSLVLNNFKSYAGRREVGPFHASFSSVVGPNGSGKSNVIDSLLFVFGFRASKMRQGKISALIHNSAAFPNLDFCEVEVHFQEVMDVVSLSMMIVVN